MIVRERYTRAMAALLVLGVAFGGPTLPGPAGEPAQPVREPTRALAAEEASSLVFETMEVLSDGPRRQEALARLGERGHVAALPVFRHLIFSSSSQLKDRVEGSFYVSIVPAPETVEILLDVLDRREEVGPWPAHTAWEQLCGLLELGDGRGLPPMPDGDEAARYMRSVWAAKASTMDLAARFEALFRHYGGFHYSGHWEESPPAPQVWINPALRGEQDR